ncbi:hypothetical protein [Bacillus sp. KH172YL63]|uniref:hypothetical protein n=1 Tax=Bacillus sp. KH172YL63 TaxID=2709784 RepID=UPI0013E518DF|nr:hypothetical protein [Bacillus sp. KH172YL63]BCB04854.1 hypothetical protein KH172YL63_29870 [Bacillus sp. KH172YL63]
MNKTKQSKKEIIISEIQTWKQTKMLPEQYCDYLLALYTGEGTGESVQSKTNRSKRVSFRDILIAISIVTISLFVIYFTELSIVLQTAILTGFVGLLTGLGIYYSKKRLSPLLLYCSAACIAMLASIEVTEELFQGSTAALYTTLFLNCIAWVLAGMKWRMSYFAWSGSAGMIMMIIYILL